MRNEAGKKSEKHISRRSGIVKILRFMAVPNPPKTAAKVLGCMHIVLQVDFGKW